MRKASLLERLRYAFDNAMSGGTVALLGWLGVLSLALIAIAGLVINATGVSPEGDARLSFGEAAWESLMRTLDPGTMGGDTGWGFRFVMLGVTLGGILIVSTLIGILTTGIEGKLDELRKGRSRVIENNHTVILGWSQAIFTIISELVIANANQSATCIVVLGNKDKVEMEDEIRERVGDTGRTRVVCRHGDPIEMADLDIASLDTARSIIILSPGDDDDAAVIKTMLAIVNNPQRRRAPYHIVAEIRDPKNLEVARMVARDEAELVLVGDLISRIMAQTCRQSGLSVVYTELLDFGGDEIYFQAEPGLTGQTFGEALLAYEDSSVIGLSQNGLPKLNPPMDTRLQDGDRIIAISEDDDTVRLSGLADVGVDEGAIQVPQPAEPRPERTLILGWNWRGPSIINELDHYVAPGSALTVVAQSTQAEADIARCCTGLRNQSVTFQQGDTTDRRLLDSLGVETYHYVIILCYSGLASPQQADAHTLITLLHLRDIATRCGNPFSIVSEMIDIRNRNLAEVTQADDFIVSEQLVSLMLSQVSENKALNAVFADLFDPEGSEIYLKPAAHYVALGRPVNFYTVVESARRQGHVALGYRKPALAGDASQAHGVFINPDKSGQVTFEAQDRIIVLAED